MLNRVFVHHIIFLVFGRNCSAEKCRVHGVGAPLRSENIARKVSVQELEAAPDQDPKKNRGREITKNAKENVKGSEKKGEKRETDPDLRAKKEEEKDRTPDRIDRVPNLHLRLIFLVGTSVAEMLQRKNRGKKRKKGEQKWKGKGKCKYLMCRF